VARLILDPGRPTARTYRLQPGTMLLGRSPENHICVLHESVSRRHAQLDLGPGSARLIDLHSTRGTYVNGVRVLDTLLQGGEEIHLGEVHFQFTLDSEGEVRAPLSTTLQSAADGPRPTLARAIDTSFARATIAELQLAQPPGQDPRRPGAEQRLRMLLQVSQILSGPEPIDALLHKILDLVFSILDVSRAVILLIDDDTGELVPRVSRTRAGPGEVDFSRSIVQHVRDHNVAALFADAGNDARVNHGQSIMLQSIRAAMGAPLRAKDRVLGVLYLDNTVSNYTEPPYTEADLDFVAAFAAQAAIALENAALYRKIERDAVLRSHYERFFPPTTIKKISASTGGLETIEAEVTALFCDITGFTTLSSGLRPREVVALLNEYFALLAGVVFRHEGTLEKYIGDALLAVWGAPFPHPDDVERAVRAAVDMQRGLGPFNEARRAQGKAPIEIHVGLNTGLVAAGNIGSPDYLQYATVGDATNVASRVCSAAAPGEVLITDRTRELLPAGAFRLEALDPVMVKGKSESLQLFRVLW
jgi:adenylate cyclase